MRTEAEIAADARPGRAFSNGTEFDIWASRYCYECVHDDSGTSGASEKNCPILTVALISQSTPREWVTETVDTPHGPYTGIGTCTEFEQRPEWPGDDDPDAGPPPGPTPECDGQLDLVDAYLPTALDELLKAPERVS